MRYWLSFDLGLQGNYVALYEWLDTMGAKECGDNVATFETDKTREEITEEFSKLLDQKARIYIINMKQGGKFVLGRRKDAPWSGYAERLLESGEEV